MMHQPGFQPDDNDLAAARFGIGGRPTYDPGKLNVKFNGDFDPAALLAKLDAEKGVKSFNLFPEKDPASPLGNVYILEMDPSKLEEIKNELGNIDGVTYVEKVPLRYLC